jgi:hypothetical protein
VLPRVLAPTAAIWRAGTAGQPVRGFARGLAITDLGIDNQVSSVTISVSCLNSNFRHSPLQE